MSMFSHIWNFRQAILNDSYGWHFSYLTIIGLSLATATFAFGLLADIFSSPRLFLAKNALSVASAPLEVLISLLYWSLRTIDPALVMPEWAPPLEMRADLSFHAVPAIVLAIDLLFLSPPWTIEALPALALSATTALAYYAWVELCHARNGFYPYPLFEQLPPAGRIALFVGCAVAMALSTAGLKWVNGWVNGATVAKEGEKPGDVKEKGKEEYRGLWGSGMSAGGGR
ncbi:hypothetical protein H2201_007455 [Coniosporium apollinis]|uniref:EXPERA domain-containing protein n=1 Tax=Coniosporium apollinis TaxID=61459 RepID=A0ABQ9NP69_9PEZI|nr:hypothetical protein H2201_007455 [Coniosporium apollinis]